MDDKTKEQRYEDLVNAMSKGELGMVKFLWNIVDSLDALVRKTPQGELQKLRKEVDAELKKLKDNPPKDGHTPTRQELLALILPLIKKGDKGDDGHTPTEEELLDLIESVMPDMPTVDDVVSKILPLIPKPKPGKPGKIPAHRWQGTFIQFQNPDGSWGELKNLQGAPSEPIQYAPQAGSMPYVTVVQGNTRFEGVNKIVIGDNLTAVRTPNGVIISGENGGSGGGGGNINFETPTGTIDDSNDTFTVSNDPLYIVVNGAQMFEGAGYTYLAGTITLDNPIGTGGFIRSAYGSGISVETPTGTVDDSNTTFTVANEPLYIVINGAQYFAGAGYTYLAGTITLDNPVGTGGIIRSIY